MHANQELDQAARDLLDQMDLARWQVAGHAGHEATVIQAITRLRDILDGNAYEPSPLSESELDLYAYAEAPGVSTPTRAAVALVMAEYDRMRRRLRQLDENETVSVVPAALTPEQLHSIQATLNRQADQGTLSQ